MHAGRPGLLCLISSDLFSIVLQELLMKAGVFSRFLMHRLRGGVPARLPIALPYSLAGGGGGGEGGDGGMVVSPRSFTLPTLTPVATTLMDTWGLIPPASLR